MNNNYLCHYGKGHDDSPPGRGSGRYAWGSGKSGKKHKNGIREYITSKKQAKQAAEAEKRAKLEEERKKHLEVDKERVLREATATEVLQYKNQLTNAELINALNRIKWTNELSSISQKELSSGWTKVDSVMDKVGKINNWTTTGLNAYRNIERILKIFEDSTKN